MSPERFAFVIRLWQETNADEPERPLTLRGSLQLVNSNQTLYFDSLEKIPDLLRQLAGWETDSDAGSSNHPPSRVNE